MEPQNKVPILATYDGVFSLTGNSPECQYHCSKYIKRLQSVLPTLRVFPIKLNTLYIILDSSTRHF